MPSSVEDCVKHMGESGFVVSLDFVNGEKRNQIESYLREVARKNGYKALVLKRENSKLYAF